MPAGYGQRAEFSAGRIRRAQLWAGRRFQGVTFNAPTFWAVILKAAELIFQLRAIIGLCRHNAGAFRKQCPEHSQRHQIWFGWHSPQSWGQCPGGCILRRSFCRAEVGPPLSPEKWKGVHRMHTLASRHGSTLLNIRAAAQATFPGKEKGRPSLHPAASHPRQASHTCRGMGFRAVR